MEERLDQAQRAQEMCEKLSRYFGAEYEVTSNNIDVVTIRSNLSERAYVESQDLTIIDSIANEFDMALEDWRIVVANRQMGLYCFLREMHK